MLVGLLRGLVFEVLSLVGWVAAYFAAQWLARRRWRRMLPIGAPGGALNHGAAFVLVFVARAGGLGAGCRALVRLLIHATPLQPVDRVLGAGFGLLRGAGAAAGGGHRGGR